MNDGIKETYRRAMKSIFAANPRVERAVLFGSRAAGAFTPASDVDIALFGADLTLDDLARLQESIDSLTIPQQVDLLLFQRIKNEELLRQINKQGFEWYVKEE